MSEAYKKLIKTLRTLFEMDKADLDFGIYRILNQKRDEINRFLEQDLLPQVKVAFADYAGGGKAELQVELTQAIEQAKQFGVPDPEQAPPVQAIKARLASAVDITGVENEVYSHLHTFFSRYYDQGDFISQRRYKADTYAIPYEGEEVKMYWANHDQHYVKSSEHLRDYAFTVHDDDGKTVRIKLVEGDSEKDNVKAAADQERRFVLDAEQPLRLNAKELQIRFNYVSAGKKKQDALNSEAVATIFAQKGYNDWLNLLRKPAPTENNPKRTLLEKHLNDYTARNTYDYFIHNDLGGFLRRELDFYIKSEVLHLDDIDDTAFTITEAHLRKIKVLRAIAHKIIRMLAQIEDFQKKLWFKKKFVVNTQYCMTLDHVPPDLYSEIATNTLQRDEWIRLFSINNSNPLTPEILASNQHLVLDTRHFNDSFTARLLSSINGLEERLDGLVMQAENFAALLFLMGQKKGRLDCIYIDPPYNTDASAIIYKNGYKNSSWISLVENRARVAKQLLHNKGVFCLAIDDEQASEARQILGNLFEKEIGIAVVRSNPQSRKAKGTFSPTHEYAMFYGVSDESTPGVLDLTDQRLARYPLTDEKGRFAWLNLIRTGSNDKRADRPKLFYPIYVAQDDRLRVPAMTWSNERKEYIIEESVKADEAVVYPIAKSNGVRIEKRWHRGHERIMSEPNEYRVRRTTDGISIDFKTRIDEGSPPNSWWDKKEYASANYGAAELKMLFGEKPFDFPKARTLVEDCLLAAVGSGSDTEIIDFFAGSGTTGHASIELSRRTGLRRKYILTEMGQYCDSVIIPRLKKAVYSANWKDAIPSTRDTGVSHFFKYIKLESYEDTLNNLLVCRRNELQQDMLNENTTLREDYILGYWLDVETADSPSLLNIDQFEDPFNYKLNIASGSVGAFKPTVVDLVETFNYLLGLRVKHIDSIRGFMIVTGTNPQEESVLVIWRKVKELDNAALEAFMDKQGYNPRDTEFDRIYVNGDHTLEDPHSKVKMTEIEFKRLMFDVQEV